MTSLVWFRRDLRLAGNPALQAALARGQPIVPVFILDDADAGAWAPGAASRWWLHGSLEQLSAALNKMGSRLVLRRGPAQSVLESLTEETRAGAVFWNRCYEPSATRRDARIKAALSRRAVVQSYNAALLCEPWTLANRQGAPYRVFTPFRRALFAGEPGERPADAPKSIPAPAIFPAGDDLASWRLRPETPDWAGGLRQMWQPGERAASERLSAFLDGPLTAYHEKRDFPAIDGTSRLSPHLHFGEIGPHQVIQAVRTRAVALTGNPLPQWADTFLAEIAWREFSHHLLFHFPELPTAPLRAEFASFPWEDDPRALSAWQRGRTGYPIVDAGMRQLWTTGWMHNRVRMIVASFLVKDLLQPWRLGADWFWDTLADADLANNAANWQWVAGCGADAAPYFRIFNPALQGAKFDPGGHYVRRWVPELARLPDKLIHTPWAARPIDLADAGITPGKTYPLPIVDHAHARIRALSAFGRIQEDRPVNRENI